METLELWCSPAERGSVLELRPEVFAIGLSENTIILQITSAFQYYRESPREFKKKKDGRRAQFQRGNLAPAVFMNTRKRHFPARHGLSQEGPPKRSLDGAPLRMMRNAMARATPPLTTIFFPLPTLRDCRNAQ
jgi:hypothetical protein